MDFKRKRWIYLILSMVIALCAGVGYAWSVFQKPFLLYFGWSLQRVSITFTIQVIVSTMAPVFLSRFLKKLGTRKYLRLGIVLYTAGIAATGLVSNITCLYLVYGLSVGLGIAFLYPALMAYATGLFPEKTGMASGLLAGAYGCGAVLWAPIAAGLIETQGIRAVFFILAFVFFIIMFPASGLIADLPAERKAAGTGSQINTLSGREYHWKEMLRTVRYYILLIVLTLGTAAGLMIAGHASGMLQDVLFYSPERAAFAVGFIAVSNTLGRVGFGFLSDKLGRYSVMVLLFLVMGTAMILLSKGAGSYFISALLAVSACYGGFTSLFSPLCADNFGLKNLSVNYAFLFIAYGIAGLIGPQLAASARKSTGGYGAAFVIVAAMAAAGIILTIPLIISSIKARGRRASKLS